MRIGIGFDVHRFADNRPLMLGGVKIDYSRGLMGHSDADVLIHAICDAILGALGEPDIGQQFPPHDERFKNIASVLLLEQVAAKTIEQGYELNNLDCVVIGEEPQINPYREAMINQLSATLKCQPQRVNIKATTTEGLGFCGRQEGLAAWAAVTLKRKEGA